MRIAVFDSSWEYTLDTPYNKPLGGTQSAICFFLEEMALRGHDMYLFNKRDNTEKIRNVIHTNVSNWFNFIKGNNIIFDLIIISCIPTELFTIKILLNDSRTMFGLWTGHDIDQEASKLFNDQKMIDMIDIFFFVSNWQRMRYVEKYSVPYNKTYILRNGIGKPFEKYLNMSTNKIQNSMTYCSIPWRGLELLIPIFKKVKEHINDASLNIFSGMNIYNQQEKPGLFDEFKKMDSVKCNYGVSQVQLAEELYKIDYLSYPNTFQETSCITALQAMACGCLIVTSNLGALKESMNNLNEYVDINIHNFDMQKYIVEFSVKQIKLMKKNNQEKEVLREKNRQYIKNNYLYSIICQKFENDITNIINEYKNYINNEYKLLLDKFTNLYNSNNLNDLLKINFKYYHNINDYYTIKINLGVIYHKFNANNIAKKLFKLVKSIKSDFNINKNLALLELQSNNYDKFIKYAKKALYFEFDPILANLLAEKLEMINNYHEASGIYQAIIDIQPDNINCLNNLGNIHLLSISDIPNFDIIMNNTYDQALTYAIQKNEHRKKELILSNMIFNNLYNWKLSNEQIFKNSCIWYDYFPKDQKLVSICNKLSKNISTNKIRIGYISTDFITHPVGYMFDSILKNHNTNKFEIFCYDNSNQERAKNDIMSIKLRNYNNAKWFTIENKSDDEILTQIINDDLDILVDMMGHTRNTRMNILQYKPARIIVSYFAYPSTNGLKEIDYRFTDIYATPPDTQKYFVEKLYYLPNGFQCYTPPKDIESNKDYSRDEFKIHLCCFNNPIKLSKPTIETFSNILKKLPQSKLFLRYCYYNSSYIKARIFKQFIEFGISPNRIDIGHLELSEALKFYNKMDIVLDPFPYNGGTISSEAIYMNTPFITLEGTNYVSRVGVSLLSNLGLQKYIAKNKDEYVQKVIDLANNPSELRELHQTLRLRMLNSDLANSKSFTLNIENAYFDMCSKFNQ
jgi:predicted O-linked N-acetylglucosamine transferase (SPINDLY family)